MYNEIVAEVQAAPTPPDFVFFTGDLAFSGQKAEYDLLEKRLLTTLKDVLPDNCPLFTVPGNHDVDRRRVGKPRLWAADAEELKTFQQISEAGAQKRSDALLPRFAQYRALEQRLSDWKEDWLASPQGSICKVLEVQGHRIAVIGINTAWLCQDDEDWGKLTAGKTMVEEALKQARDPDIQLRIVLGHHPLYAMTGEKAWSDGDRIRGVLERANAVYLHGHLHTSGGQVTGDSNRSTLSIQAPSGFQAADSKRWRNGLMWGQADLETGELKIEPMMWSDRHSAYVFEVEAAHPDNRVTGEDAFVFSLPGHKAPEAPSPPVERENIDSSFAEGWEIIDAATLAKRTDTPPTTAEMSDWFDGRFPQWEVATAKGVRPRQVVEDLLRRYQSAHHSAPRPVVTLLTGAGGEGKSAALLQLAAGLLRGDQNWTCIHRYGAAADLPPKFADQLPHRADHAWIIAVDDAEYLASDLAGLLKSLQPRTDIHLILAARGADWLLQQPTDMIWQGVADFQRQTLAGLTPEDARRIANGWAAFGSDAMGKLRDLPPEKAAEALLAQAQEMAARQEEGALLGALLITREGEDLKQRVVDLMAPMRTAPGVGDKSLLDVYAMIAAMHSENQLYLTRTVLAAALNCDEMDLEHGPLRALRQEAMVDGGETYLLTRHRQIAEVARDWLRENDDIDRWYPFLARAALQRYLPKDITAVPDISNWCTGLSRHFEKLGKEKWHLAQNVAKALYYCNSIDPKRLNTYASTLRHTGQKKQAFDLLQKVGKDFTKHGDVLHEWAVAAGMCEKHYISAWLELKSLEDTPFRTLRGKDAQAKENRAKNSISGLGTALGKVAKSLDDPTYSKAQAACGRLGLRLSNLEATTRTRLETQSQADPTRQEGPPPIAQDVDLIRQAVDQAIDEIDPEDNPAFYEETLGVPDRYRFSTLLSILEVRT